MFPHLEDEHFKVVPLQQVAVVCLQLLHLDRLFVHALPHILQVPAHFARALEQLADAVGCADVGLGQPGHVHLILEQSHQSFFSVFLVLGNAKKKSRD